MSEPGLTPPGWYRDPLGRAEHRYWDGTAWTDQVASAGRQGVDPVQPPPPTLDEPSVTEPQTTTQSVPEPVSGPVPPRAEAEPTFDAATGLPMTRSQPSDVTRETSRPWRITPGRAIGLLIVGVLVIVAVVFITRDHTTIVGVTLDQPGASCATGITLTCPGLSDSERRERINALRRACRDSTVDKVDLTVVYQHGRTTGDILGTVSRIPHGEFTLRYDCGPIRSGFSQEPENIG